MAFAPVKEEKSCNLDQSGSGKTLAYLAPVVQRLRQEEVDGVSKSSSQSPRLVVLVPTTELASQVCGFRQRTQLESLQQGIDMS
ncbi:LOW QUALITY PROTEIN: P-loop containing nucleoside triphosphate hydrolase [Trema orientale]|uniref:P-loop containing nucleoside triphosphate hydrolase n=1 Tax=Trema orientale TaxID=63057 RepID=A0A2P5A4E7_TREOI|nr:LOW QUALITY PROTEIN: P-loop containing nucleoside triphosphate hydrolase [Trema orientale]